MEINQRSDTKWNDFLAVSYAEGFGEGEESTTEQQIEAWAWLIKSGQCWSLQGFFGRAAKNLIGSGVIDDTGTIDWEIVEDNGI